MASRIREKSIQATHGPTAENENEDEKVVGAIATAKFSNNFTAEAEAMRNIGWHRSRAQKQGENKLCDLQSDICHKSHVVRQKLRPTGIARNAIENV
jgi:hypothetical protein